MSIIIPQQHGFCSERSTVTNLLTYQKFILDTIDSRSQVDSVYTYFTKAFDKVSHGILCRKLEAYCISGTLLRWLENFLVNRTQLVKIKTFHSTSFAVPSGVPQGSHLEPFLFLLYINDIHTALRDAQFLLFADDLKIYLEISSHADCERLQITLDKLQEWYSTNQLQLNVSKCSTISFSPQIKSNYTFLLSSWPTACPN